MAFRRLACLLLPSIGATLAPLGAASPQYCIGSTGYIVRDETGAVMDSSQIQRLTVSINGVPQRLRMGTPDGVPTHFEHDEVTWMVRVADGMRPGGDTTTTQRSTLATNPLVFGPSGQLTLCGQLGDLTLTYEGKVMRLIFDIGQDNSHYAIEGPPFQEGTFHLGSLACEGGASPPWIDNRLVGSCVVRAESWEGMDADWVRHVLPLRRPRWSPPFACQGRSVEAITTPERLAAAVGPSLTDNGWRTYVDFRTMFILALYQPTQGYTMTSFKVDKQGDLTFTPPPLGNSRPDTCTPLLLVFFRSGIRSIEGKPLPPPPTSR